jgi:hypothetical protein
LTVGSAVAGHTVETISVYAGARASQALSRVAEDLPELVGQGGVGEASTGVTGETAPLYFVGVSVLVVAGALGITVYVFKDPLGYGELAFIVRVAGSILLLASGPTTTSS